MKNHCPRSLLSEVLPLLPKGILNIIIDYTDFKDWNKTLVEEELRRVEKAIKSANSTEMYQSISIKTTTTTATTTTATTTTTDGRKITKHHTNRFDARLEYVMSPLEKQLKAVKNDTQLVDALVLSSVMEAIFGGEKAQIIAKRKEIFFSTKKGPEKALALRNWQNAVPFKADEIALSAKSHRENEKKAKGFADKCVECFSSYEDHLESKVIGSTMGILLSQRGSSFPTTDHVLSSKKDAKKVLDKKVLDLRVREIEAKAAKEAADKSP